MKTEDLIATLSADTVPPPRLALGARLGLACGVSAIIALVATALWLGLRPDMMGAMHTRAFWMKACYTGALSIAGFMAVSRLARPGGRAGAAAWILALVVTVMFSMSGMRMIMMPADHRMAAWLGASWTVCTRNIVMLSIPVFVGVILVLRQLAPTRLRLAGAGAGLLAGALGATVYGLHCPETGAAFVATWYSLGVATWAAIGALLGPRLLRW